MPREDHAIRTRLAEHQSKIDECSAVSIGRTASPNGTRENRISRNEYPLSKAFDKISRRRGFVTRKIHHANRDCPEIKRGFRQRFRLVNHSDSGGLQPANTTHVILVRMRDQDDIRTCAPKLTDDVVISKTRIEEHFDSAGFDHPRIHRPLPVGKLNPPHTGDFLFLRKVVGQVDKRIRIKPQGRGDFP